MKVRLGFVLLVSLALIAGGCGDGDKKSGDKRAASNPPRRRSSRQAKGRRRDAKKAFDKKPKDVNLCRDLAMKYVALASPESTGDPKKPPTCRRIATRTSASPSRRSRVRKIDSKNRDVQQMLASTYMATGKYDKASPLLEDSRKSSKGQNRANDYYAWGLAASNAQDFAGAIEAWTQFAALAPAKDPRVPQVKQSIKALQAKKNPPADTNADKGDRGRQGRLAARCATRLRQQARE